MYSIRDIKKTRKAKKTTTPPKKGKICLSLLGLTVRRCQPQKPIIAANEKLIGPKSQKSEYEKGRSGRKMLANPNPETTTIKLPQENTPRRHKGKGMLKAKGASRDKLTREGVE